MSRQSPGAQIVPSGVSIQNPQQSSGSKMRSLAPGGSVLPGVVGGCDLYVQRSDGEMPSTAPAMSSGRSIRPPIQYSLALQGERPTTRSRSTGVRTVRGWFARSRGVGDCWCCGRCSIRVAQT